MGEVSRLRLTLERKSMPMVAWYILSKESYMNRVMSEVFPTVIGGVSQNAWYCEGASYIPLCSPRKTSLYRSVPVQL
jgi:hypothetical protein